MDPGGNRDKARVLARQWPVLAILLLAGLIRFYRLDLISVTEVTGIQVLHASAALSSEGWQWPLAGPPTEEVRSSSFLISGIAMAFIAWWHPFSGTVFVIALHLAGIVLLFRMCEKQFGNLAAVLATLLYATSPWGVVWSRLMISASCLTPFVIWFVLLSLRWLDEKRKSQLVILVLLGFVIPQIHFSGICAPLWLSAVLYIGRKDIAYRSVVTGCLLGAIAWTPWIAFQQLTGWVEVKIWAEQILQSPAVHGQAFLQSLKHLLHMLHSTGFDYWMGADLSSWPGYFPVWQRFFLMTVALLLTGFLLASIVNAVRVADRPLRLLLAWIALPLFIGALLRTSFEPENLLIAFPVPLILVGVTVARLQSKLSRTFRFVSLSGVIVIAFLHVVFLAEAALLIERGEIRQDGHYELSYRQRRETIVSIFDDAGSNSVQLVGPFFGGCPAYEYVQLFEQSNGSDSGHVEKSIVYWIDEQPMSPDQSEETWMIRKERQINRTISKFLGSPPDWKIERHWQVGFSQVYRLRFVLKKPLS